MRPSYIELNIIRSQVGLCNQHRLNVITTEAQQQEKVSPSRHLSCICFGLQHSDVFLFVFHLYIISEGGRI